MELVKRDDCSHTGPRQDSEVTLSLEDSTGGEGSGFGLGKLVLILSELMTHLSFWTDILSSLPQFPL